MSFASPKFPATIAGSERNFIRRGESQVRLNRAYEFISHYTFDFLNLRNLFVIYIYMRYTRNCISHHSILYPLFYRRSEFQQEHDCESTFFVTCVNSFSSQFLKFFEANGHRFRCVFFAVESIVARNARDTSRSNDSQL